MAIKSKAQIQAESNSTYVDNSSGNITPTAVRSLNTNWIDSILFEEATGSLTVFAATSASFATTASRAISAASAATASFTLSSSFATSAATASFTVSSSFATSASFATTAIVTPNAYVSGSQQFGANTLTLFKGDTTGDIFTINNVQSATLASTASLATRNLITASAAANIITFTKGDGTTFNVTVAQSGSVASASYADFANAANFATSASYAFTASSAIRSTSSSFAVTASYALNVPDTASFAISSSRAISAESATSASFATTASFALNVPNTASFAISASRAISSETASFAPAYASLTENNTLSGTNAFNNAVTMSNVKVTGTASIAFLDVTFQSSSVIYSSGSNQFGDASNDTQTLYGTVNVITGPLVVTGSANFKEIISGSIVSASFATSASRATSAATASFLLGTVASASFATTAFSATSASFATLASTAINATSASFASTAGTANNANNIAVTNIHTPTGFSARHYPLIVNNASGYKSASLETDIYFDAPVSPFISVMNVTASFANNAATSSLAGSSLSASFATSASRAISAATATSASFATTSATASLASSASSITLDNFNGINSTYYLTMADNASGFKRVGIDTDLAYNPSTNILTGLITSASYAYTASSSETAANALTASSLTALNQTVTITGSVNVSGSIRISQGDDLITHHVQAAAVNGVEIQNNTGNVVAQFGAGGGLGTTFNGQINGTAFSGSGALVYGVVSSSFATSASYALTASYLEGAAAAAFPFTGSAGITGSLNVVGDLNIPSGSLQISGSATINSGSLIMYSYKLSGASNRPFEALVTQSLNSTNNIISITANSANTGSMVISGSGNYVSLGALALNTQTQQGSTVGFSGTNAYVTILPATTGSNPNYNTVADRNNRRVPQITNANSNATINITDNRASETSAPFTLNQSSNNMSVTVTLHSGSLSVSNSALLGTGTTFLVSGSGTLSTNAIISNSIFSTAASTIIAFNPSSSNSSQLNNSILVGANLRVNLTGSSSQNSTASAFPSLNDSAIIGRHLIVTGSSNSGTTTANIAVFGAHNTADGLLNDGRFTKFAIGTGTADASRSTAFHVSASGMTTVNAGLNVRGVETGSTELEVRATGVKIGNLLADSHNLTGSFSITGSQTITGSLVGQPISQSVSSNTASLDLATGNFFNLTLPASTNTYITASGQIPGQTINLKITQQATTGSVTIGAGIKQVSGSAYTVTATANAVDIVTFISFDETGLYLSNVKNLI